MKTLLMLLIGCAMIFTAFPQVAMASDESANDGAKKLFESKCSICHSVDRPKSKKKSRKGWETTVLRMKNANGCPITDDEAKIIIDYLSEHYGE